jgi:iron complex transport system substrate-binding protein
MPVMRIAKFLTGFSVIWMGFCPFSLYAGDVFPRRIISLAPALTEELYLLNTEQNLVGVTTYCRRPPEVQKKEKVGTITELNLEKAVSLNPDLILTTSLTNARAKKKLKNLGIRTVNFPYVKSFQELCSDFQRLGEIVGRKKEADDIIKDVKDKVGLITNETRALPKPAVFIQIGAKPLHTVTRDSFLNDFIGLAGGTNIAFNAKSGLYSREMVLKQCPDVIIIVTMGIAGEKEKKNWERFKTIKAVKNRRIHIIDSYKFCSPTPVTFVKRLEEMVKILHE